MADAFQIFDYPPASSGKSIPSILNRKRKSNPKTFMSENQENSMFVGSSNDLKSSEAQMRSRSPLLPIEFNFATTDKPNEEKKPATSGLVLRDSWKRFRDAVEEEEIHEPKAKVAKMCPEDLWLPFKTKERKSYKRSTSDMLLSQHPSLSPRMRTILLDWLIEVCEVYRLHRETFYLAADFFDRYMSREMQMPKTKLQLIGVTCLFISAKIEEIYPPKLQEFAYVTDGACTEEDILAMELVVLKKLNWSLSPKTPNAWTKLLLQLESQGFSQNIISLINPSYSGETHRKIMHLLDLCMLDITSLNFSYPSLAASAMFFIKETNFPEELDHDEISRCISWMTPFAKAVNTEGFPQPKYTSQEDISNLQPHSVNIELLTLAHRHAAVLYAQPEPSSDDMY